MKRGKKSAAELALVITPLETRRPPPPEDLTEEQASEWRAVVSRMPADWFCREHFAMLASYCRHVCRQRSLAKVIDQFKMEWIKTHDGASRLDKLLAMGERSCARSWRSRARCA